MTAVLVFQNWKYRILHFLQAWGICLFLYFMSLIILVLIPSAFNISLGLYKLYMSALVKVFDYGRRCCSHDEQEAEDDPLPPIPEEDMSLKFLKNSKPFDLFDVCKFSSAAAMSIIDDDVTKRFDAEELPTWNLLTRTYMPYQYINFKIACIWFIGCSIRYFILLPTRLILMGITIGFIIIGSLLLNFVPAGRFKKKMTELYSVLFCRLSCAALCVIPAYHNKQYKPTHGICVANHTTPLDFIALGFDGEYRTVGQIQPGFFAMIQRQMARIGHIFFERKELDDRSAVSRELKEHALRKDLPPILIFPEGTCINNTSVMLFKKGTFEISDVVNPVALKYNPIFGDPFWNSSASSYGWYLLHVASSWLIYVDVWYLPPMKREQNESASNFAGRVQKEIATQANIIQLGWDGQLKRSFVPPSLKIQKQKEYAESLILRSKSPESEGSNLIKVSSSPGPLSLNEALLYDPDKDDCVQDVCQCCSYDQKEYVGELKAMNNIS